MHKLTGNKFWQLRSTHGRAKIFGDATLLWEEACAYFDWCDRHPWERTELVKYKGDYEEAEVPLGRPYSMDGLTIYLGVSGSYFRTAKAALREKVEEKRATEEEAELLYTMERIEQVCRTQVIEGSLVGVFNANLSARYLGLADNINNVNTGETVLRVNVRDKKTAEDLDALGDVL